MKPTSSTTASRPLAALFRRSAAVGLLLVAGLAGACEADKTATNGSGAPATWVLSLNQKVSVAARCSGMVETISRMLKAGTALRVSIFGYDKSEGSRSLSLAYVAAVTEELRSLLLQKGKGQVRVQTVFGAASENAVALDPDAFGRIEIQVQNPGAPLGS